MRKKSYLTSLVITASFLSLSQGSLFADVQPTTGKSWFSWGDSTVTAATGDVGPQGPTGPRGKRGRAAQVAPLKYDLFVDANRTAAQPNGSISQPFATISDALAAIQAQAQASSVEMQSMYTILVAGGVYTNEPNNSLTISGDSLRVNLVALGEVYLGSDASPMSIIWQANSSNSDNADPVLSFSALSQSGSLFGGKFIIPGEIVVANSVNGVLDVSGSIGGISSNSEVPFDLYLNNCQILDEVDAPNASLQLAEKVIFKDSVQVGSYGSIRACDVQAGMDIGSGCIAGNVQPQGILLSNCAGSFTSSTSEGASLIMDSYTAASFITASDVVPAAIVDTTVQMKVIGAAP